MECVHTKVFFCFFPNRELDPLSNRAANVVERRIRQVEAVVDVHSIQTAQGMFGFGGLR
jgi:hypothetical protein